MTDLTAEETLKFMGGLWKLNRRIKQSVQPLIAEQYGLDIRKYFILQNIRHGRVYPKQIAENLDMPSTLLSRYLDGLHTQGLIERQIDPHDSRRTLLSVTPAGQTAVEGCTQLIGEVSRARLQHLPPQKLAALLDAMRTLEDLTADQPHADQSSPDQPSPDQLKPEQENQ